MEYTAYRRTLRHRIKMSLRGCRPKLSLRLCRFEEEFCLDLFGFLIALPFLDRWHSEPEEMMEAWGPSYHDASIWWSWGNDSVCLHMPWTYEHIKHEVRRPDDSWVPFVGIWEVRQAPTHPDGTPMFSDGGVVFDRCKEPDGRWQGTYPYHYLLLPSGEVQHATATIHVERREWRQKWLRWCPWFAKRRQSISIDFDREMGSEAGSWKGGVMGTGYDMRHGEEPEETLRRMQKEHRFDR